MKAVVFRRFGGPDVLELTDWPDPEIGPDEVLMRVRAVSIGRTVDLEVRQRGADLGVTPPRILGSDPAGLVAAVGPEVEGFRPGDRVAAISRRPCGDCDDCRAGDDHLCGIAAVLGVHEDGGYAELCRVKARMLVRVPESVSFEQAAAIGLTYPAAWNLLRHAASVKPGELVLVMAAAGGIGIAGANIARALGARVIAAAGTQSRARACATYLQLDDVVSYGEPDWVDQVRRLTPNSRGVDLVFENISSEALFGPALNTLRRGGRLVTCGSHGGGKVTLDIRRLYRGDQSILARGSPTNAMVREVWAELAAGRLRPPPVVHTFPLAEARAAHEFAGGRDAFGRVILTIA